MKIERPPFPFSRAGSMLMRGALIGLMAVMPASFAQQAQPNAIPVKNWPVPKAGAQAAGAPSPDAAAGATSPLVFISITPCRVLDTRGQGGSGLTGLFGPPSIIANQARIIPVPSSTCGVPVSAAYSMNFVSITPVGQPVGWVAAWQDDTAWPGTVVLNAPLGGIVDNSSVVPAGADGGIQVLATNNCDLVIDMNGYYVQATTIQGQTGPPGPAGSAGTPGATGGPGIPGATGVAGAPGATGIAGAPGATGVAGVTGAPGVTGAMGATGLAGVTGAPGVTGAMGVTGVAGATGALGATGATGLASSVAGPAGATGAAGVTGATGSGATLAYADFFALMPPDNAVTVAPGTDVSFPEDGPSSGGSITRTGPATINLAVAGTYQVMFQVSVTEPGQLLLTINGADLAYTVVGRASGDAQIVGIALVTTSTVNSILTVRNPAGNSNALTITPLAGGARPSSAHLVITQLTTASLG